MIWAFPPAGGQGYTFQTFFAEKAQKGFPLLSLTHKLFILELSQKNYRLN